MRLLSVVRPVVRLTCLVGLLVAWAPSGALALDVQPAGATVAVPGSNHGNALWPGDQFNVSTAVQNGAYFITSVPNRAHYGARDNQQLTNVRGTLSGDPTALSFSSASSAFPNIPSGGKATNNTPFSATLSAGYECGAPVPVSLALHADQGDATLPYALPTGTAAAPQSYDSSGPASQIPDPGSTLSTVHVGDTGRVKHLAVRIGQIIHPYDSDLKIQIIAPDGTTATLVTSQGGAGHDYANTVFDDGAGQSIDGASAPFTGTYKPEQPLSVFDGKPMTGNWTLRVTDQVPGNSGVLVSWGADLSPATCSLQPVASFTATPNSAPAGSVTLDARNSSDPAGNIVDYAWDLDGNGTYETDQPGSYASGAGRLTHTFTRGAHVVGLKVTDDQGHTATKAITVNVGTPPVVTPSASPAAPQTGQPVTLTANAHAPDAGGSVVRYQWDLDGNGTFETDTGASPSASTTFPRSGPVTVAVRVTDDAGVESTATLQLNVTDPPPPPSGGGTGGGTTGGGSAGGGPIGGGLGGGTVAAPIPSAPFVGVLGGSPIQRLASVASHGLSLTCRANRTARCSMTLQLSAAQGRRMHLRVRRGSRMVTVGSASVSLGANRTTVVRLRLTRSVQSALRRTRLRSLALLVVGTVSDSAGHTVRVNRVILVRR